MTGAAAREGRHVILVDLSGTPDNRRVMRSYARFAVGAIVWLRRLRGRSGPQVLIFAPAADGKSVDWPEGADLVFTDELLDTGAVEDISTWVEELSARIVAESDSLWPRAGSICLGRLNLSLIQEFLLNYAQVTEGLRRVLDRAQPGRCTILSGYAAAGHAMRADVLGHAHRIQVRSLPGLPHQLRPNGGLPPAQPPNARLAELRPRVLIVSESRPMAGLFGAIEPELAAAGCGPNLRVQYDTHASTFEVRDDTSLLHLPRPELVAPARAGFLRDLRRIEPRVRALANGAGLYHPPLDLLFETLFAHVLPRQVRHIAQVRQILHATKPELVVVGNDRWWLGMAWVLEARELGIPTLAVQDGVAWDTPMWTCATADHIAVNGTQLEALLRRRGFGPERLSVVGQPRYDGFNAHAAGVRRPAARERLGLEADRFAVLFATQPNQDASYVRRVADAILAVPDVQLLLRPHPSTPPRARAELERIAAGERVLSVARGDIFDLIAASDLIVVQNSTVALEAALLGRPVVTANLTGMPDVVPYASLGISAGAKDAHTVTTLVEHARAGSLPTAATDERTREGIYFLIGPTDGRSAARVAGLIGSLLAERAHR